jgi:uncharacterized membrane protein
MPSNKRHLLATCLWVIIVLVTLSATTNVVMRSLASVPLVFFLPGLALLRALGIDRSLPERYALAIALSIAVTILGGFVLGGAGLLTPLGWAAWLSGVAVTGSLIAAIRGNDAPVSWQKPAIALRHWVLFGAAVIVTVGTSVLAVERSEYGDQPFRYTDFWMVPDGPARSGAFTIGVKNAEPTAHDFDIEVTLDGRTVAVWRGIRVNSGQTLTRETMLPTTGRKAEAWLFKSNDPSLVYRKVSAAIGDARNG